MTLPSRVHTAIPVLAQNLEGVKVEVAEAVELATYAIIVSSKVKIKEKRQNCHYPDRDSMPLRSRTPPAKLNAL